LTTEETLAAADGPVAQPERQFRTPSAKRRVEALDGLRGLVIISVAANHFGSVLWPRGWVYDIPVVNGLLGSGAVSVFFVVGAFIVTRGLLRESERGGMDPLRFYLRRMVRLGPQLVILCLAVAVVLLLENDEDSGRVMTTNALHVLTYTYNLFGSEHFFDVRSELGHLWYLSVQQQCYLVLPLLLAVLARRRAILVGVLLVLAALVVWHRDAVLHDRSWVFASTLTTTRADGLICGVVMAVALPWMSRVREWGRVLWVSALVLVALKLVLPELSSFAYLGTWSVLFTVTAGIVVVAIWQATEVTRTLRVLAWSPLQWLGKASLSIFIWHLPVAIVLERHTPGWPWALRTLLALSIIGVVAVFMDRYVDDPIRRLLATRGVFRGAS